jgi:hypothetical protein
VPAADSPSALLHAVSGDHGREYLAFLVAFVLGELVILLWPLVYVAIAIYSRRSRRDLSQSDPG